MACSAELDGLPEGCIADILSLTTPPDVCRLSLVSKIFRSAAESDAVWERFLLSDYQSILAQSDGSFASIIPLKKKQLFFHLCDNPLLIDGGMKTAIGWLIAISNEDLMLNVVYEKDVLLLMTFCMYGSALHNKDVGDE